MTLNLGLVSSSPILSIELNKKRENSLILLFVAPSAVNWIPFPLMRERRKMKLNLISNIEPEVRQYTAVSL